MGCLLFCGVDPEKLRAAKNNNPYFPVCYVITTKTRQRQMELGFKDEELKPKI